MAKKVKITSNPDLAQPHKKGAEVKWFQSLIHKPMGTISYEFPQYFAMYFDYADASYSQLKALEEELLKVPVDNKCRILDLNNDIYWSIFFWGNHLILHIVLTVEHLVLCMQAALGTVPQTKEDSKELSERFLEALKGVGFRDIRSEIGFQKLTEIINIRNKIMHPHPTSLTIPSPEKWDNVPIAWILSEKDLDAYEKYRALILEIINYWYEEEKKYKTTVSLTVQRGIQFEHDVKNPPK